VPQTAIFNAFWLFLVNYALLYPYHYRQYFLLQREVGIITNTR